MDVEKKFSNDAPNDAPHASENPSNQGMAKCKREASAIPNRIEQA